MARAMFKSPTSKKSRSQSKELPCQKDRVQRPGWIETTMAYAMIFLLHRIVEREKGLTQDIFQVSICETLQDTAVIILAELILATILNIWEFDYIVVWDQQDYQLWADKLALIRATTLSVSMTIWPLNDLLSGIVYPLDLSLFSFSLSALWIWRGRLQHSWLCRGR